MKQEGAVKIEVYNVRGERVTTLLDEVVAAGNHSITWDGLDAHGKAVSSGVYFYKMKSQTFESARKMILMK
jgi:flagellar hook assembly protein FlgD